MTQKPMKSPTLAAVNQHLDERYEQFAKRMDKALPACPPSRTATAARSIAGCGTTTRKSCTRWNGTG